MCKLSDRHVLGAEMRTPYEFIVNPFLKFWRIEFIGNPLQKGMSKVKTAQEWSIRTVAERV